MFPGQLRQIEGRRLNSSHKPPELKDINKDDPHFDNLFKCVCGGRVKFKALIPERGVIDMVCTAEGCGVVYSYPIGHPWFNEYRPWEENKKEIILAPGFTPADQPIKNPPKIYRCIDCKEPIPKDRALQTLDIFGRALCEICQGREE